MTLTNVIQRKGWILIAAFSAIGLLLVAQGASRGSAQTAWQYDRLKLSGAEEVPVVTANTAGLFSASFDAAAKTLTADLSADGTTLIAAHLHLGAKGANGPVVVPLYASADGVQAIHPVVLVNADTLSGPLKGDWAGFVKALAEGNIYANVHSKDNPGGVIRVQLPAHPEVLPPAVVAPKPPATGSGISADSGAFSPIGLGAVLLGLSAGGAALMVGRRKRA